VAWKIKHDYIAQIYESPDQAPSSQWLFSLVT